jgi:Helix-turn-helix domain
VATSVVASYIEDHVADEIPLATMAQLARMSPYHFSRAFRQSFGTPPHQFHVHRRVERAKSLLRNPALSITSIGMAVGFSDASAFSTAFRSHGDDPEWLSAKRLTSAQLLQPETAANTGSRCSLICWSSRGAEEPWGKRHRVLGPSQLGPRPFRCFTDLAIDTFGRRRSGTICAVVKRSPRVFHTSTAGPR